MKISKETKTDKPFEPYSITIQVETLRDEQALLKLSQAQYTVPELLYPCNRNPAFFNITTNLLNNLMKAIQS